MFRKNDFFEYYVQRHYGTDRIYILASDLAKRVTSLTGNKTVSMEQLDDVAYLMGATPREVLPPRSTKAAAPAPARDVYNAAGVVIDKRTGAAVRDGNGRAQYSIGLADKVLSTDGSIKDRSS